MTMRWIYPLDPECPAAKLYKDTLLSDPMTKAMGAPVDDILEGFAKAHRINCARCREYGVVNVDLG